MAAGFAIDSRQFRNALGAFTTGVTIVTTLDAQGGLVGLTANSFNSVSLEPPLVLWSLANSSLSLAAFEQAAFFVVHVLARDQQALSDRFARRGEDKFAGLALERGVGGVPLLDGCMARFQCRTAFRYDGGDHRIFVGEVIAFDHFDRPPLVFQAGGYGVLVKPPPAPTAAPGAWEGSFNKDFLGYLLGTTYHQLGARIRKHVQALGFDDESYFLLTMLGAVDHRERGELDALLQVAGHRLSIELVAALCGRGLIEAEGTRLHLTEAGRCAALELFTIAKAAEADMLGALEYNEGYLLKQLLAKIARSGAAGLPPLWPRNADPQAH